VFVRLFDGQEVFRSFQYESADAVIDPHLATAEGITLGSTLAEAAQVYPDLESSEDFYDVGGLDGSSDDGVSINRLTGGYICGD
jgi:hypothetical protein